MRRTVEIAAYYDENEGKYVASCEMYENLSATGMTAEEAMAELERMIDDWQKFSEAQSLTTCNRS